MAVRKLQLASAGTKTFKVRFSYDDPSGKGRASATVVLKHCEDKAHAKHVFESHPPKGKKNLKLESITEVKV